MTDRPWPRAGLTLFADTDGGDDRSTACLPVVPNWTFYRMGFQLAVLALLDRADEDPDFLVFPIVYNLRHALELTLKEILGDAGSGAQNGHNLQMLWQSVQSHLQPASDADREAIAVVGKIIAEVHEIDARSTAFRYPVDKKGGISIPPLAGEVMQRTISLAHLRKATEAVFHFCNAVIERLDWEAEAPEL